MIGTGIWGFADAGFVGVWTPGIRPVSFGPAIAAWCSLISIAAGAGLVWRPAARKAGFALLAWLALWLLWSKGPPLVHAPADPAAWESAGETVVLIAAAWALADANDGYFLNRSRGPTATSGPRILYGLALIAFGISHFGYSSLTASLVPAWLPSHLFWVYLTGTTYLAAGVALVAGRFTRTAAILSALQMALFGVLVWLPKIARGAQDADTLNETAISFALAAGGWVIATAAARRFAHEEGAGGNPQTPS
jgi:uncharacterized membrane protein